MATNGTKFKKKSAEKPQDSVLYIDDIFITSNIKAIFFVTNLQLEILSPLFVPTDKKIDLLSIKSIMVRDFNKCILILSTFTCCSVKLSIPLEIMIYSAAFCDAVFSVSVSFPRIVSSNASLIFL